MLDNAPPRPKRALALALLALVSVLVLFSLLPVFPTGQSASVDVTPAEAANTPQIDLLGERETPESNAANTPEDAAKAPAAPPGKNRDAMTVTVPKLGLKDVPVPSGSTQEKLDREGILRMSGSGVPWREGSNTFIAGHTLGYERTRVPYAFYDLEEMRPGDEILIKDSAGKRYTFRVFDRMTVRPEDYWVTYPSPDDRTIVSLQACVPVPTFEKRLIVQGELVG